MPGRTYCSSRRGRRGPVAPTAPPAVVAPMALVAVLAVVALALLAAGCGSSSTTTAADSPASSVTVQGDPVTQSEGTAETVRSVAVDARLFDGSFVHEISVSCAQEDYEAMIDAYSSSGEKEWIAATVTIDGVIYRNVGMRLKGNSSIMGLQRGGDTGRMGGGASAETPEALPWLIDLDREVDGQHHRGVVEFVVRSNNTETALNEAVALGLLERAGLASQDAVAVRFTINGGDPKLRLVIENPDDVWMAENFGDQGALYKAESTGDYSYRGTDPASYDEVFDQEAGHDTTDLTPLLEFLDFINNADDETFNAELADRLDVDGFATYLAMQELIANTDDIDGPGNNSYLHYDSESRIFTVVAWDHNLAFGGMGVGGGDGGMRPGGEGLEGRAPANMPAPENMPALDDMPAAGQDGGFGRGGAAGGRGFGGRSNILVERFKANPAFVQLYEDRLAELRTELYASGAADGLLQEWVTLLKTQATDLVDASTVEDEAARISEYFTAD